jgi:hypothetical protein
MALGVIAGVCVAGVNVDAVDGIGTNVVCVSLGVVVAATGV